MYKSSALLLLTIASASAFAPLALGPSNKLSAPATRRFSKNIATSLNMEDSSFLKGVPKPASLKNKGLSDAERAAAQSVDSEAAWEAAQKQAASSTNIAVDFNPYDAETGYWLGEWICADCGFIYGSRGETQAFETLGRWYKCPQCAGPRRRFAKKLGNKVGGASGDGAILISTGIGLVAILGAFIFGLQISAF